MHIVKSDGNGALGVVGRTKVAGVSQSWCVASMDTERNGDKLAALLNPRQAVRVIASERLQRRLIYVVPTVGRVE